MPLNIPALQQVRDRIAADPARFNMQYFVTDDPEEERNHAMLLEGPLDVEAAKSACGTVACIAGWTNLELGYVPSDEAKIAIKDHTRGVFSDRAAIVNLDFQVQAAQHLGLDYKVPTEGWHRDYGWIEGPAGDLFFARGHCYAEDLEYIGADDAIKVLNHLIETGEVDWSICNE